MKYFLIAICCSIVISLLNGCRKSNNELPAFDYEKAAGLWVPYEAIDKDGTIIAGPFTTNSLFGSYAESVQLNKDQTFIPVTWFDKNAFELKTPEAGNFEYLSSNKLLFKDGLFDFECDIIKFENDDLWLKIFDVTYKFKRQF
ncbi:MAG TPA: hypothetical protein VJU78_12435 [Chitinophagaceae bacterium]|nr:hypothetical protein [Chitinophagaceae bacterium]